MSDNLTQTHIEILQEVAGVRPPPRPWGAHVGACLEFLFESRYITAVFGGTLTQKGKDALAVIGGAP